MKSIDNPCLYLLNDNFEGGNPLVRLSGAKPDGINNLKKAELALLGLAREAGYRFNSERVLTTVWFGEKKPSNIIPKELLEITQWGIQQRIGIPHYGGAMGGVSVEMGCFVANPNRQTEGNRSRFELAALSEDILMTHFVVRFDLKSSTESLAPPDGFKDIALEILQRNRANR